MKKLVLAICFNSIFNLAKAWPQNDQVAILPLICNSDMPSKQKNDLYDRLKDALQMEYSYSCMDGSVVENAIAQAYLTPENGFNLNCGKVLRQYEPDLLYQVTIHITPGNLTCWIYHFPSNNQCSFNLNGSLTENAVFNDFKIQLNSSLKYGCSKLPPDIKDKSCDWFDSPEKLLAWWNSLSDEWKEALMISFNLSDSQLPSIESLVDMLHTKDLVIEKNTRIKDLKGCRNMTNLLSITAKPTSLENFTGVESILSLYVIIYNSNASVVYPYEEDQIKKARAQAGLNNKLEFSRYPFK